MRGSRKFRRGGGGGGGGGGGFQVNLTKKALTFFFCFFFCPQLILQKSNGYFQRKSPFFKVPGGPTFSRGVQLFPEPTIAYSL